MLLIKNFMPQGKKQFLANVMEHTGSNRILRNMNSWSGLLVLNYHRIGQPQNCRLDGNLYSATAERFEKQLKLYQQHAELIRINEIDDALKARSGKHILITFDDGYRDNYDLAFPVLKTCEVPATFFIATNFIDHPQIAWWDEIAWTVKNRKNSEFDLSPWLSDPITITKLNQAETIGKLVQTYWSLPGEQTKHYLKDLARATEAEQVSQQATKNLWMDWEMIQEMADADMDVEAHTMSHPVMAQQTEERQRAEIIGCRDRLQEVLGRRPTAFSYPVGQPHMFNQTTKNLLQEAGFQWAFSFYGQYASGPQQDSFDIPRCAIDYGMSDTMLHSRLTLPQIFSRK